MLGRAEERRAREPRDEEARSTRSAVRIRVKADSRIGRDPDCGVPRRESKCDVNVMRGCFRASVLTELEEDGDGGARR